MWFYSQVMAIDMRTKLMKSCSVRLSQISESEPSTLHNNSLEWTGDAAAWARDKRYEGSGRSVSRTDPRPLS
jgi:hypothetical protein